MISITSQNNDWINSFLLNEHVPNTLDKLLAQLNKNELIKISSNAHLWMAMTS